MIYGLHFQWRCAVPDVTALQMFGLVALGMALTACANMIYLISRSISQGRRAGFISLGGVVVGFLFYMLCAAFGITAFVFAVPYAYDALRCGAAAYLLYLVASCQAGRTLRLHRARLAYRWTAQAVSHGLDYQPGQSQDCRHVFVAVAAVYYAGAWEYFGAIGDARWRADHRQKHREFGDCDNCGDDGAIAGSIAEFVAKCSCG